MLFELAGKCEAGRRGEMYMLANMGGLGRIHPNEIVCVRTDGYGSNARTGQRVVRRGDNASRALDAYMRDALIADLARTSCESRAAVPHGLRSATTTLRGEASPPIHSI